MRVEESMSVVTTSESIRSTGIDRYDLSQTVLRSALRSRESFDRSLPIESGLAGSLFP